MLVISFICPVRLLSKRTWDKIGLPLIQSFVRSKTNGYTIYPGPSSPTLYSSPVQSSPEAINPETHCPVRQTNEVRVTKLFSGESEAAGSNDPWCCSTLKKLKEAPPLSLKVSLRSIREGRFQTLQQCFAREYWMTLQAISGQITNDFSELRQVIEVEPPSPLRYLIGAAIMMIGVVLPLGFMMFRNKRVPSSSSYSKQT
ncbi:hypothetical protein Acr_15g0005710 [Actinidia rufa]|uniref:Enoyl-CoA hydratase/isomerase domain-containing protein n=1 Tax=Actinidia rufa TaxID=165716 RepID=A0A7J0FTD2_9ERIC|nr:hypothetical protein Acr_15g0005710 [Actinidia rufa]